MNYLETDGKKLPVKFGWEAYRRAGINMQELTEFNRMDIDKLTRLFLAALQIGHEECNQEMIINEKILGTMIDSDPSVIKQMIVFMIDSLPKFTKKNK
jgi:hypothetical protein